jgi:CelD/BcsL family acetyltransferase involved in cellulose biosynthesis
MRKKVSRALGAGGLRHAIISRPAELDRAVSDLFEIHARRANSKGIRSTFVSGPLRRFHGDVCRRFLDAGILNLHFLYHGTQPVSAAYAFRYAEKVFFYQTGMDPEWSNFSVGSVILYLTIKQAFDEGYAEFDFLNGDQPYKNQWATGVRQDVRLDVFRSTVRGTALLLFERARDAIRRSARFAARAPRQKAPADAMAG